MQSMSAQRTQNPQSLEAPLCQHSKRGATCSWRRGCSESPLSVPILASFQFPDSTSSIPAGNPTMIPWAVSSRTVASKIWNQDLKLRKGRKPKKVPSCVAGFRPPRGKGPACNTQPLLFLQHVWLEPNPRFLLPSSGSIQCSP